MKSRNEIINELSQIYDADNNPYFDKLWLREKILGEDMTQEYRKRKLDKILTRINE